MIDKISGNGGYDLSSSGSKNKRKNPAVRAYESTPGPNDAAHKRAAEIRKKGNSSENSEDAGVILDLSGSASGKKKGAEAVRRKNDASWTDALRRLIHPLVRWLKDFWESDRLKEDAKVPDITEVSVQAEEAEGTASKLGDLPPLDDVGMDGIRVDAVKTDDLEADEIKAIADRAVQSGDLQQIEQFVTRNGAKRLAHNSDLLTYYDRRGKFVEMDETEKHRVLFGDRNVLKL